ncbi:MAG: hypothetical protein ACJA1E_001677 [Paracoccaceae bacterium]|jgi:hypothetical protein
MVQEQGASAPSVWRRVSQQLRQICSALMDLKNISTIEFS